VGRLSIEVVAIDGNYQIFSLETLRQFALTFYTFRTYKMKVTANLFLRIESAALMFCAVILQHKCFDPGFIVFSCQVLLHTYIHGGAVIIQGIQINFPALLISQHKAKWIR